MSANIETLRELIQENRFAEARQLLKASNHPKKTEWLAKLAEREAAFNPFLTQANQDYASNSAFSGKKALPTTENPAPAPNLFASILRVFIAGLIAFAIVPILMILLDTQVVHMSQFLMDDNSRRIFTVTGLFVVVSAICFGLIARFIAGVVDLFAGVYYASLFFFVVLIWHYGSFYIGLGLEQGLNSPFTAEAFTAYWHFLESFPPESFLAICSAAMSSLPFAFTLGALSTKELENRMKESNRRR